MAAFIRPNRIMNGLDASSNQTTITIDIHDKSQLALTAVFSSATNLVGSLQLQGSGDGGVNFVDVGAAEAVSVVSGADSCVFDISRSALYHWRLQFTNTSGSATLDVFASVKE